MALITCPECGRRITDLEDRCIGCGLSMEKIRKIQIKRLLGEKIIKCVSCGTEYELYEGSCPNCKCPAMSLTARVISNPVKPTANDPVDYYESNDGITILPENTAWLAGFDGEKEWLILAKEGKYWLLLSKYCQTSGIITSKRNYSWDSSEVRQYLNTEFLEKFTEKQRELIVPGKVTGNSLSQLTDLVFLLSKEEFHEYAENIDPKGEAWKNPKVKLEWALRTGEGNIIIIVTGFGYEKHTRIKTIYLGAMSFGYRPAIWIDSSKLNRNKTEEKEIEIEKEIETEIVPERPNLQILSTMEGQESVFVALTRDPVNLILFDLRNNKELYNLFSDSEKVLFFDGELGIGRFEWNESENKLTYHKHYIVHNKIEKVEVYFKDRDSFRIQVTPVNSDNERGFYRDFEFI